MSLKSFHLIFILLVIVCAELFGAREFWYYSQTQDALTLFVGVLSVLGGLATCVYAFIFVRKMDEGHI